LIGVRGPYGNNFEIKEGKLLLIGGGTGLVPLMRLLKFVDVQNEVVVLIGSKTKNEVFFEGLANDMLAKNSHRVIVATEDDSYGEKGFVTDLMEQLLQKENFDAVYTCGPELMMYNVIKQATSKNIFVQASIERMMKCGVGICGSCCMGDELVCRDGTIFDGKYLLSNTEFGHTFRNKAGVIENY